MLHCHFHRLCLTTSRKVNIIEGVSGQVGQNHYPRLTEEEAGGGAGTAWCGMQKRGLYRQRSWDETPAPQLTSPGTVRALVSPLQKQDMTTLTLAQILKSPGGTMVSL